MVYVTGDWNQLRKKGRGGGGRIEMISDLNLE